MPDERPPIIERLVIHKGDTLVLRYPNDLTPQAADRIKAVVTDELERKGFRTGDVTVWVLSEGASVQVLTPDAAGEDA